MPKGYKVYGLLCDGDNDWVWSQVPGGSETHTAYLTDIKPIGKESLDILKLKPQTDKELLSLTEDLLDSLRSRIKGSCVELDMLYAALQNRPTNV